MDISEATRNTKLLIERVPYSVENIEFVKPGKGRGIYHLRLRNLFSGNVQDITYHSGDKVEETSITIREMQYLYEEGGNYIFMDNTSFEQTPMTKQQLGDKHNFLKEGMPVTILMWEEKPIDITLPKVIELKVVRTEASLKGATVTAQQKAAILETGATVGVPAFIKDGDVIKVDTRDGTYIERAGSTKG